MLPGTAVNFSLVGAACDRRWVSPNTVVTIFAHVCQGCGNDHSAVDGWPRPACMAAQALRTSWLGGNDEPLLFNVDAAINASALRSRLWSVYDRIQEQSDAFIHKRYTSFCAYPCLSFDVSTFHLSRFAAFCLDRLRTTRLATLP
jgi:hypothetical protein